MGKWRFRKPEPSHIRGVCVRCEKNPQKKVSGQEKYRPICSTCDDIENYKGSKPRSKGEKREKKFNYRHVKKKYCEHCGFVAVYKCQLDVDHIDGNSENNSLENLQTLCANCHRLKTYVNKDWQKKKPQGN